MEYQTCTMNGSIQRFNTFKQAYESWNKNKNIFKISYNTERWVVKTKKDIWSESSEEKLCELNEYYKNTLDKNEIFWVNQSTSPDSDVLENIRYKLHTKQITREEYDKLYYLYCIRSIVSNTEFVKLHQLN